jgi:hypothetical protein
VKAHLIDSETPLIEGQTYSALCGAEVKHCVFVYMFNTDCAEEFLGALSTINTCRKCFQVEIEKRYVYGIVPAQEAMEHDRKLVESAA